MLLRPLAASDAAEVQALVSDPEVALRTANIPHPYPPNGASAWIISQDGAFEERGELTWAVCDCRDETLIGAISLTLSSSRDQGVVGYWIGRSYWNQGYASEALRAVLACGFKSLKLELILAQHIDRNHASARVMEKCGLRPAPELSRLALVRGKMETLVVRRISAIDYDRSQ